MSGDLRTGLRARLVFSRIQHDRGFTLVELMVVVGMIVLVAGGIGFALGDPGGNSLATAQKEVAAMVGRARAQAAVGQTETILAIYGARPPTGDPDKFLRLLQVFRNRNPGGTPSWEPVGSPVLLPRGVYVVPPSTSGFLASGVVWPTNPPVVSNVRGPINLQQQPGTPFGAPATAYVLDFAPDGTIAQVGTLAFSRLAVATAALVNNVPQFNNPGAVRGLLLRPTGGMTFVNEANGF